MLARYAWVVIGTALPAFAAIKIVEVVKPEALEPVFLVVAIVADAIL